MAKNKKQNRQEKPEIKVTRVPKVVDRNSGKRAWSICLLFILGLTFVVYQNTFKNEFVLDDFGIIKENKITKSGISPDNVHRIFISSHREGEEGNKENSLYRPLTKSIFTACWQIGKGNPRIFHLVNVSIYALTCMLMFMVLYGATKSNWIFSLITTSLYVVHPLHAEVVANNKSLDEILSVFGLFVMLRAAQLYCINKTPGRNGWLLLFLIGGLTALFSKENLIVIIGLVPLFVYYTVEPDTQDKIVNWFGLKISVIKMSILTGITVAASLFFLWARFHALSSYPVSTARINVIDNVVVLASNSMDRITTAIALLGRYILFLFLPMNLSCDYSYSTVKLSFLSDPYFIISFITLISLIIYSIYRMKQKDWIGFGIIFFLISSSIISNIFFVIGTSFGDRLMFLPSIGWCISITGFLFWVIKMPINISGNYDLKSGIRKLNFVLLIAIVIIGLFGYKTIHRNEEWKSNERLFSADLKKYPESAHLLLLNASYMSKGAYAEGKSNEQVMAINKRVILYYQKALSIYPAIPGPDYGQLGKAYSKLRQMDSALYYFMKAYRSDTNSAEIINNIGSMKFEAASVPGNLSTSLRNSLLDSAEYYFRKAYKIDSIFPACMNNLGAVNGQKGKSDVAIYWFTKAYKTDSLAETAIMALSSLGLTYNIKGDSVKGTYYYKKADEVRRYRTNKSSH